jgi:hypothetical protein
MAERLGTVLRAIASQAALASAASSCLWSVSEEQFTSRQRPPEAERGVPVEGGQCAELCLNPRATSCDVAVQPDQSLHLRCRGEQQKSELLGLEVGDDCQYQMGHPKAVRCKYTAETGESLEAEWLETFSATGSYEGGRLQLHGASCTAWCGKAMHTCTIAPDRSGPKTSCFTPPPPSGRKPAGLSLDDGAQDGDGEERALASSAALEAASIVAFRQLASELSFHQAPPELVQRARRAARDEARHYRALRGLSRVSGRRRLSLHSVAAAPRSLVEIATDNAVEGCVRETFGALCALWQAAHAPTAERRAVFASIAGDEVSHGELAWDLHRWLWPRLDAPRRREVMAAMDAAREELATSYGDGFPEPLPRRLGLPDRETTHRLLRGLEQHVLTGAEPRTTA